MYAFVLFGESSTPDRRRSVVANLRERERRPAAMWGGHAAFPIQLKGPDLLLHKGVKGVTEVRYFL
jgi:hypothetical protein